MAPKSIKMPASRLYMNFSGNLEPRRAPKVTAGIDPINSPVKSRKSILSSNKKLRTRNHRPRS